MRGRKAQDVVISVTDEGPGIKPADLERIFEKFYRGGRADGRKAGTGLGLSICKGLVEAMGGKIEAQSPAARRRGTRIAAALSGRRVAGKARRRRHEDPRAGGRRRGADPAFSAPCADASGYDVLDRRDRRAGAAPDRHCRAGRDRARPRPARHGRQGRAGRGAQVLQGPVIILSARDRRRRRSPRSTSAPTITSKSLSPSANFWRACAPPCAMPRPTDAAPPRYEADGLVVDLDKPPRQPRRRRPSS